MNQRDAAPSKSRMRLHVATILLQQPDGFPLRLLSFCELIGGVDGDTLSPDGSGDNESGLLFPCGVRLTIEHEAKQVRILPDQIAVSLVRR